MIIPAIKGGVRKYSLQLLDLIRSLDCFSVDAIFLSDAATFTDRSRHFIRDFIRAMRIPSVDLIIVCHYALFPLGWVISIAKGSKLVCVVHGDAEQELLVQKQFDRGRISTLSILNVTVLLRAALRISNAVIFVTEQLQSKYVSDVSMQSKGFVVRPWLSSTYLHRIRRDEHGAGLKSAPGRPVLLTVTDLSFGPKFLGLRELVSAFARLGQGHSGATLIVAGAGPGRPLIEKHVRDLGLSKDVSLLGWTDDVESQYLRAHLFLMISKFGGFDTAILEAMAHGLPIIADNRPDYELLLGRAHGIMLVEPTAATVAHALELGLLEPHDRAQIASSHSDLIEREFSEAPRRAEIDKILNLVISSARKQGAEEK
jgi:glycosyltransferase involved in cell wall biosynthesis